MPSIPSPELPFQNRVALVTGASGGIGRALALGLAKSGAAVAVAYASGHDAAEQVARLIKESGGKAITLGGDLARPETAHALVDATERGLGRIDVLVACAGTGPRQTLEEISVEDWNRVIAVNTRAPFLLVRRVVPGMRERKFGRILFVSSVAAFTGGLVGPHYAASKAALHGLTYYLAAQLATDGITVNAIAPALVEETGMLPGPSQELARGVPVGRLGRPQEVADLSLAILSNSYLTGKVLPLDGGLHPR